MIFRPTPKSLETILCHIDVNDRRMHRDRRSVANEQIDANVLKAHHQGRRHEHRLNEDDQKTADEMNEVQTEGGVEKKNDIALLAPQKTFGGL